MLHRDIAHFSGSGLSLMPEGIESANIVGQTTDLIVFLHRKADLVVLGETLTYAGVNSSYADCAETIPGPSTDYFGELAKKHELYVLKREPNMLMLNPPWVFGTKKFRLGVPQGQHSGFEDCFMRYAVADAYAQRNSNIRFWVSGDELKGIFLCDKPNGTGVNAAGRTPQSRYGDAANAGSPKGRGNCKGQICVNDRYLRDGLHDRKVPCP